MYKFFEKGPKSACREVGAWERPLWVVSSQRLGVVITPCHSFRERLIAASEYVSCLAVARNDREKIARHDPASETVSVARSPCLLDHRIEPIESTFRIIRKHIKEAVGSHPDVANATKNVLEQSLLSENAIASHFQSDQ
jgi:hypothetical protein